LQNSQFLTYRINEVKTSGLLKVLNNFKKREAISSYYGIKDILKRLFCQAILNVKPLLTRRLWNEFIFIKPAPNGDPFLSNFFAFY
jgi:hypothetical protein